MSDYVLSPGFSEVEMALVHGYRRWDISRGGYVTTPFKGAKQYIAAIRGEIIPGTTQEVDDSALDDQGRYDARQSERR